MSKEKQFGVDFLDPAEEVAGFVTGSLSGFYNRFYDFIDFTPEAGSVDGNRIFDYAPIPTRISTAARRCSTFICCPRT